MLTLITGLEIALPIAYAVVFALYVRHFLDGATKAQTPITASHALYATLTVHLVYLVGRGFYIEHIPVSSRAEFLSLVAICIGVVYAVTERRHGDPNTGPFFVALAVGAQTWSSFMMAPSTPPDLLLEHPTYGVHVLFTVFGFTALAVSAIYALMYILLSRQLKSRNLGIIFQRLPSLSILEKMSKLSTIFGVIFLGIGLLTGHLLAVYVPGIDLNILDPKIAVTYLAWFAYVAGLLITWIRGLSGRRMAYLCLGGYLALIASMVVINSFLSSFHSFQ